ncbi:MAG: maleylpyruvate isomerase family mycothiol-dependent enzyme [Pseudonocardiaceae bacterium]
MTETDYAALYRESRARIAALVRAVSAQQRDRIVPGCPRWSVADTVAHLAAVATDVASGLLTTVPTDEQTAEQVAQRRGRPLDAVLGEWERAGNRAEQALAAREIPVAMVHDVLTHEADIRGALNAGRPPKPAWSASLDAMSCQLRHLEHCGTLIIHFGTIHLGPARTGPRSVTVGSGEPATTVDVDAYEFWRALVGRRSRAQMAAWQWSADPAPYLRAIPVFGPTEADLTEPE